MKKLVSPAVKNEGQGYRFYSADNIVHIRLIRVLQDLGLSLAEIRDYFHNTTCINDQLNRLISLRDELNKYIDLLQLRQSAGENAEIHRIKIPAFTTFCKGTNESGIEQKTSELRQTYIEATKKHSLDLSNRMFIQRNIDSSAILYAVPVIADISDDNICIFPETEALCTYYRGPYEMLPVVHNRLLDYAKQNSITYTGYFRNIYLEGPPTH